MEGKIIQVEEIMNLIAGSQNDSPSSVGARLRYWRKVSGMRLVDIAEMINVSQGSLSDLENDKSLPSSGTLIGLCKKTELNICWLLTGKGLVTMNSHAEEKEVSVVQDFMELMQDRDFRKMITKVINIFKKGTASQKAQIHGFLAGVDSNIS